MDIYRRAATGMTDKQAIALVTDDVGADSLPYPPADMWEGLKAWLAHFFPGHLPPDGSGGRSLCVESRSSADASGLDSRPAIVNR